MLLSFAIIFYRWHNLLCNQLSQQNPSWNDEELFNEARKRVIAQHQVTTHIKEIILHLYVVLDFHNTEIRAEKQI